MGWRHTHQQQQQACGEVAKECQQIVLLQWQAWGHEVEKGGKKKQSMEEKVKQWVGKVHLLSQKLSKQIVAVELKLPACKRSMPPQRFTALKAGLAKCRETKERVWDELEDMREPKSGEEEQTLQLQDLQSLHSTLTQHLDALVEASSKQETAQEQPIKEESEAPSQNDEAEAGTDP